jgi:ABC-type transporter MlaC component
VTRSDIVPRRSLSCRGLLGYHDGMKTFYCAPARVALPLVCALLCGLAPQVVAQTGEGCPGEAGVVSERVTKVFRAIRSAHSNALPGPVGIRLRDKNTSSLIVENIAPQRFASELLRGTWERGSAAQQARWQRVLGALLRQRVSRALRSPLRYVVTVDDVIVTAPCEEALALLTLRERAKARQVQLELKLVKLSHGWRVWDISTDDASLVMTWRPRFQNVARERGVTGLDRELEELGQRLGLSVAPRASSSTH